MKDNVHTAGLIAVAITLVIAVLPLRGQLYLNRLGLRFPAPTAQDLDRGYVETVHSFGQSDLSIQTNVSGNTAWSLYLATEQPFLTPVNLNKPHYHLLWKLSSEPDGKYRPISLQKMQIAEGKSSRNVNIPISLYKMKIAEGKSSRSVDLDFRLKLDWSDSPGEYSTKILFVLKATREKMKRSKMNVEVRREY